MIPTEETIAVREHPVSAILSGQCQHRVRVLVFALLCALPCSAAAFGASSPSTANAFVGRWDLTIQTPSEEFPAWIWVTRKKGAVIVRLVGRTGEAHFLPKAEIKDGEIDFTSPKEMENREDDMFFRGRLSGEGLVGTTAGPDGTQWNWTGKRAPTLKRNGAPHWGRPISLFNGQDFDGWKFNFPDME